MLEESTVGKLKYSSLKKNSGHEDSEKLSDFDLLKPETRWSTPSVKQPESKGWTSKPSSSAKSDQTSSINRLRLPKGKRKLQLLFREKGGAGSDLQILHIFLCFVIFFSLAAVVKTQ